MKIQWTGKASADLVRLHAFLQPVAPDAAARVVQQLARAPDRLIDYPRIGEKRETYEPREVRRIILGHYELRYEIVSGTIFILVFGLVATIVTGIDRVRGRRPCTQKLALQRWGSVTN